MSTTIWFVSPMYLDVAAFEVLRAEVTEVISENLGLANSKVRFVVVDDTAGRDPDVARLLTLEDVTVVEPLFNLGHQRAIVYALRHVAESICDDDIVVTLDADGEDRPRDLPRLLEP